MQNKKLRRTVSILFITGLVILPAVLCLAQNSPGSWIVRFGLTSSVVEPEITLADTLAATKVWAAALGKGSGLWEKSDAKIYEDIAGMVSDVNSGLTDMVALGTQEYIEVEDTFQARPMLTYVQAGQLENQYVILVRHDSNFRTAGDLRGNRLAMPKGGRHTLAPLWLDVLLYENGIANKQSFFKEIKDVQKPSQAILPIFFRQMEAGLVLKSSYDTAVTLNPQIGQQLRVLASSPKLVMLVVCMRSSLPQEMKDEYLRHALKLHETPGGLQAFNIFKLERLVPWEPAYLNNVRELMKKRKLMQLTARLRADSAVTGK